MDSLIMISDSGLYYMIRYGDQMRAGIDIAVENNSLSKLLVKTVQQKQFLKFFLSSFFFCSI